MGMKKFKGEFIFKGKTYKCSVKNGVRYVENQTVDEFFKVLSPEDVVKFAKIGQMALYDEKNNIKPSPKKYQYNLIKDE